MRVGAITIHPYRLPLRSPAVIGGHTLSERAGWLVGMTEETGRVGWGDCCPLPGYHQESLSDLLPYLRDWKHRLTGIPLAEVDCLRFPFPSFQCAVDQAVRALRTDPIKPWTVSLTALLQPGELERFLVLQDQGWCSFKLKVGAVVDDDIAFVSTILERAHQAVRFRLDANGRWKLDQALAFAGAISDERIEFIEEPVRGAEALRIFREQTHWPVALDEQLADHPPSRPPLEGLTALICKPSRVGGYARADQWRRCCTEAGVRFILSSCYESGVGTTGLLDYAASIQTGESCGFDTYNRLGEDLLMLSLSLDQPTIHWPPGSSPSVQTSRLGDAV